MAGRSRPIGPAMTADGVAIRLDANLERLDDVAAVLEAGADGIGLFRSEFLLAGRDPDSLSEDGADGDLSRCPGGGGAAAGHDSHLRPRRAPARRVGQP